MATTADIRNGLVIRYNGELVQIESFQHVKPGKGGAFIRTKLRRVSDGSPLENTFRSGHSIDIVRLQYQEDELHLLGGGCAVYDGYEDV